MKKLLKETEIRKMMKFANIGALSDGFVEKLNETSLYDEDDALMQEEEHEDEEEPMGDLDLGEPADDEPPMEDPVDVGEPAGDALGVSVEAGLEGLNAFLQAAMAHPDEVKEKVNVELTDEPAADDAPMDEPVDLDEPMPGDEDEPELPPEPELEEGMHEDELEEGMHEDELDEAKHEDELDEAKVELEEDDAFVNEVVRRVAKRLLKK